LDDKLTKSGVYWRFSNCGSWPQEILESQNIGTIWNFQRWALPHRAPVRNCNFGAELMVRNRWKKDRNGGFGTTKNNFCTSAPTENYFHSNGNTVPL